MALSIGSDAIYDYPCTACEERNGNSEAFYFCTCCSKQFCNMCMDLHNQLFGNHKVLGQRDLKYWNVSSTEMCAEHEDKQIEFYCENDNVLCCNTCVTMRHRFVEDFFCFNALIFIFTCMPVSTHVLTHTHTRVYMHTHMHPPPPTHTDTESNIGEIN